MVSGSRPIMSSSVVHSPTREPMKTLMGMANQAEDSGHVLNASVFGGFPQADIPHLALSSVIVCDRRTAEGEVLLNKMSKKVVRRTTDESRKRIGMQLFPLT